MKQVQPGSFDPGNHFYPQVLNAHIHPMLRYFFSLSNTQIAARYCHLNPATRRQDVESLLSEMPAQFRWGGADLFHVTNEHGRHHVVVIETNSCPSGQKSMPVREDYEEKGGYKLLLERSFLPMLSRRSTPREGVLAVLWDKNHMETSGYAAALADLCQEPVYLVHFPDGGADPHARFDASGLLHIRPGEEDTWIPVRGALRYVTQKPWNRIPPITRTAMFNPVLVCLAGGRNKLLAAKAYDMFNAEFGTKNLSVKTPETIWDVGLREVPLWVRQMGGIAVVKDPYSNAGQGVFTITSEAELEAFMQTPHPYDKFIVQALIGNSKWSSRSMDGALYHVGTVPNRRHQIYVADFRFMVGASPDGYFPVALYARKARQPLCEVLEPGASSWDMLGTNLSVRQDDGSFTTQPERLVLMDSRNFNRLGLGLDHLVEAYIQTVCAMSAIDRIASQLLTNKRRFRKKLFSSLNPDPALTQEIFDAHNTPSL